MTRSLRAATALMAAACALVGASAAEAKTLDVVLLGDSYTSGIGGGDYLAERCGSVNAGRSPYAWGEVYGQLARTKGLTVNVTNAACGGSVLSGLDSQMDAVDKEKTDLVLMTSGGNDAGFSDVVTRCFFPVTAGPNVCRGALEASERKLPAIQQELVLKLQALRGHLRDGAKVGFMSPPYLAQDSGYLLKTWFASYDSGAGTRRVQDLLDVAFQNALATANSGPGGPFVEFLPTKDRFAGHEPDQNPWRESSDQWIHEIFAVFGSTGYYHPNVRGHQEMGHAAFALAGPTGDFGVAQ